MSYYINSFEICRQIDEKIKNKIKYFYIFKNHSISCEYILVFTTSDDILYIITQNFNKNSQLQIIEQLCYKNINQFFNTKYSIIALSRDEKQLFQMKFNYDFKALVYYCEKTEKIDCFENTVIQQISCGIKHTLVLTIDGEVYGFGDNNFGQIWCGFGKNIVEYPIKLEFSPKIKYIHCSGNSSFAITCDGTAYTWGYTLNDIPNCEHIFLPKLIEGIHNCMQIVINSNVNKIYFLTTDGFLYFCNEKQTQIKQIESDVIFKNILSIDNEITFISDDKIYYFDNNDNNLIESEFYDLFNYYSKVFGITYKTVNNNINEENIYLKNIYINNKIDLFEFLRNYEINENKLYFGNNLSSNDNYFEAVLKNNDLNIKLFHVIKDNLFVITNEDNVFGLGVNEFGELGFGHNNKVTEPTIIPELCQKNIKQFFNGLLLVLAINSDKNQLYIMGNNNLEIDFEYNIRIHCLKLEKYINFNNNKVIQQIECCNKYVLILLSDGDICRLDFDKIEENGMKSTMSLAKFQINKIISIYCNDDYSIAITSDGFVYSLYFYEIENTLVPKLFIINNNLIIKSISLISDNKSFGSYFLTNDGSLYFVNENGFNLIETELKFKKLKQIKLDFITYKKIYFVISSDDIIYILHKTSLIKTNYKNVFYFCWNEFNITHKTTKYNKYKSITNNTINLMLSKYEIKFEKIGENPIGSGTYGQVFKVRDKNENNIYAVKKILRGLTLTLTQILFSMNLYLNTCSLDENKIEKILGEVKTLMKLNGNQYFVEYIDSWFEFDNYLYIQMEFCDQSLRDFIKLKDKLENKSESEIAFNYYISSELFVELIECVQYLHELKPPIIHRDLKPHNILIKYKNSNKGRYLKLCDFGLAVDHKRIKTLEQNIRNISIDSKEFNSSKSESHSSGPGTPGYMPLEVYTTHYNTKADIWSLYIIGEELFNTDINSYITLIIFNIFLIILFYFSDHIL